MRGQRYVPRPRGSSRAAAIGGVLATALVAVACSSDSEEPAAVTATPLPAAVAPPAPAADRSKAVYAAYYRHCREFTWQALVYPKTAANATDAARQYAGPPRTYQKPAFLGCLAGLRDTTGRMTVARVKRLAEAEEEEHGGG